MTVKVPKGEQMAKRSSLDHRFGSKSLARTIRLCARTQKSRFNGD